MEWIKNLLLFLLLGLFALSLLLFPTESAQAARQGLSLCLETVLPSLFPFFVLSSLCISTGAAAAFGRALEPVMRPLFGLSGAGAGALALGLTGGYPVGARSVAELYRDGALSRQEAERLLAFCNNAGPGFVMGICGGAVFHSTRAGLYLYLTHVAAAVLTGILLRRKQPLRLRTAEQRKRNPAPRRLAAAFPAAVRDSFAAAWSVCGYVVIFAVLLRFATAALPGAALLPGLLELTNAVLSLTPDRQGFVACAVLLGWGGLSVHAQTLSVLEDSGLSANTYFLGKITQAALSAPLALLFSLRLD